MDKYGGAEEILSLISAPASFKIPWPIIRRMFGRRRQQYFSFSVKLLFYPGALLKQVYKFFLFPEEMASLYFVRFSIIQVNFKREVFNCFPRISCAHISGFKSATLVISL